MSERRFRVERLPEPGTTLVLPVAVARHIRVLRLVEGDTVVLFDGEGGELDAVLVTEGPELVARGQARRERSEPWCAVLIVGLPKAAALEQLLRGATEAGASEIRVFEAHRSVAHAERDRVGRKLERLGRIVEEAARQSERARTPTLSFHEGLAAALTEEPRGALVALDARQGEPLGAQSLGQGAGPIWVVVGPEGGLSAEELALVRARGGKVVRAALPVLRVETAAVVATALAVLASTHVQGLPPPDVETR